MKPLIAWIAPFLMLVATSTALAQSRLDTTVVTVSGRSVYINAGKRAGVVAGARVVFRLANGDKVESVIVDVSASSARAELEESLTLPAVDDKAEVEIPSPQTQDTQQPTEEPPAKPVPEHPPWQLNEGTRDPNTPLLAPAFGTRPEDRPMSIHGRVFATMRGNKDLENDTNSSYMRLGTWIEAKNPFGKGGRLLFEGDADYRNTDAGSDGSDTNARIQRLSYAWGTDQHSPYRAEVGRFYSYSLPEIGLVDGAEASLRLENGWSIGAGGGLYPLPDESLTSGDDYGAHVFADYRADGKDSWMQGTIGFQQTWHEGEVDRSLLIGRVNARPTKDLFLFGSVMIDLYGSEDTVKSELADITQLVAQVSYNISKETGVNGTVTRTTWPELKRNEYVNLPPELVRDGYVDRVSGSWWRKFGKDWRLTARGHAWWDQDREGLGGEVAVDWYSQDTSNSSLYGALYFEDSSYTTGAGVRLQAQRDLGPTRIFVGYDGFSYTTDTLADTDNNFLRHLLRADVSWSSGSWYFDIDMSYTLGDNEHAISLGATAHYRF